MTRRELVDATYDAAERLNELKDAARAALEAARRAASPRALPRRARCAPGSMQGMAQGDAASRR